MPTTPELSTHEVLATVNRSEQIGVPQVLAAIKRTEDGINIIARYLHENGQESTQLPEPVLSALQELDRRFVLFHITLEEALPSQV